MSDSSVLPPPPPPLRRAFHFYKGRQLVLTVEDRPGLLFSTASPPPSGAPAHPFVNARAYDPYSEHELGSLLRQAHSFDEYIRLLIEAGYNAISVDGSPPIELGDGYRLADERGLVGVVWDSPGAFARLQLPIDENPSYIGHSTITVYREGQAQALLQLLKATNSFAELRRRLESSGYRLVPIEEYRV